MKIQPLHADKLPRQLVTPPCAPPALPNGWTATSVQNGKVFVSTTALSDSGPNSIFAVDPTTVGRGTDLTSPEIPITSANATLSFRHRFNTENGWDGGVLEISIADSPFRDILAIGGSFIAGGYNGKLGPDGFNNPISGQSAWSGDSGGYVTTKIQLPAASSGKNVKLRWRFGADDNTAGSGPNPGWFVDTVIVDGSYECSAINHTTALFDFDGGTKADIVVRRPSAMFGICCGRRRGIRRSSSGLPGTLRRRRTMIPTGRPTLRCSDLRRGRGSLPVRRPGSPLSAGDRRAICQCLPIMTVTEKLISRCIGRLTAPGTGN